jgi:hypothetical protein
LLSSANAAAVPLALRDELTRLIPGFDPGTAGLVARVAALPIAVKLATAAASLGAVATGVAELPRHHHARPAEAQKAPTAPVPAHHPQPVAPVLVSERPTPATHVSVQQAKPEPQHADHNEIRKPAQVEHPQADQERDTPEPPDQPEPQDQANQGD